MFKLKYCVNVNERRQGALCERSEPFSSYGRTLTNYFTLHFEILDTIT